MTIRQRAFTLIELLVVIAIIAILAAILFPVFAQAKNAAKKSKDLSNVKQMSLGISLYTQDTDDTYPTAYFHNAWDPANGGTRAGYKHWSFLVNPYIKNYDIFVSPGDKLNGHAPTCFASADNNSGKGFPGDQAANVCAAGDPRAVRVVGGFIVDEQAPRISYTVNSAIMPRLRNINDVNRGITVTSQTQVENVAGTILIAGLVDNTPCLASASITSVVRSASHRSTNGYSIDANNTRAYFGSAEDGSTGPTQVFALNNGRITTGGNQLFNLCLSTPRTDYPLIVYHSWNRWGGGDNYGMADGSAKYAKFSQTLRPDRYMWSPVVYTDRGIPVVDPISGQRVSN
ncbi:MAG TPA: prepilin-type N-terminal cleavage/methylation domain-containing protein [Fimbriimonadaceae bacterium]|nr:prepilin-type N-terminal cleavage/methylation domain-containing protein [Fimbriimonadaceae bacterium]